MKATPIEGYQYIVIQEGVCGNRPTIIGTRLEPWHIANYGTIKEIANDFDLDEKVIREAIKFNKENSIN